MEPGKITAESVKSMDRAALESLVVYFAEQVEKLNQNIEILTETIKVMNQRNYGTQSETSSALQMQFDFALNEAEALSDILEDEPSLEEAVPRRKKTAGKKLNDLAKITNREEKNIYIPYEELDKIFGKGKWKRLPDQLIYKLEHLPEQFKAITYHIGVYAGTDNQTIIRADKPAELFEKSIATPSLVASIAYAKFVNAVPLYRQEQGYKEVELNLSRATMANWLIKVAERYLNAYYDHLKTVMGKQRLLHADETPFRVIRDGRTKKANSYMWVYRTNPNIGEVPIVLYKYEPTRQADHPREFLKDYKGTIVCDGYQVYHELGDERPDELKIAGCWVHLKRRFATYVKAIGPKQAKGTLAAKAIEKIDMIYHVSHKIDALPKEKQFAERQKVLGKQVDAFFAWIREHRDEVAPKSETGEAFTYALNQEKYLRAFLTDAEIPLDNNYAEQAIRPFTLGRKNWVLIDTPKGADASAVIYSIVETAKANDLKIYDYLTYLLEELPMCITEFNKEIPERLLPWSEEFPERLRKSTVTAPKVM